QTNGCFIASRLSLLQIVRRENGGSGVSTTDAGTAAAAGANTATEVLSFAAERGVELFDLKFVDLPGTWQHITLPLAALDADDFESGLGFDGSSIRGFQEIHES